jgi:hypothetical protein
MRTPWLVIAAVTTAAAAPAAHADAMQRPPPVVIAPRAPAAAAPADASVVKTIYLNRCAGGCTVHGVAGTDDATTYTSSLAPAGTSTVAAFEYTDAEWNGIVACVSAVYTPYAVTITDTRPASGAYNEAMVAGDPTDLGFDPTTLGIAVISGDCHALSDTIAFVFANAHPHDATYVDNVCWTAAQEAAHLYGLDHEYVFTDGVSACDDAMTYRGDCLGEKFFRPHEAYCGTVAQAPCHCGGEQSSHRLLLERFGSATPTTAPPVVTVTSGLGSDTLAAGAQIVAHASAQRGVDHVDLLLNGFAWATAPGVAFGSDGQPAADYTLAVPADVPDGVIDVVVTAYDDLGVATSTAAVTVTKGAPCTSAATCAAQQQCTSGRCAWPAATAPLGAACTYAQACVSGMCNEAGACTQPCDIDDATTCPTGFACDGIGTNTDGVCVSGSVAHSGGFCDAGGAAPLQVVLALLALAFVTRRRRASASTSTSSRS